MRLIYLIPILIILNQAACSDPIKIEVEEDIEQRTSLVSVIEDIMLKSEELDLEISTKLQGYLGSSESSRLVVIGIYNKESKRYNYQVIEEPFFRTDYIHEDLLKFEVCISQADSLVVNGLKGDFVILDNELNLFASQPDQSVYFHVGGDFSNSSSLEKMQLLEKSLHRIRDYVWGLQENKLDDSKVEDTKGTSRTIGEDKLLILLDLRMKYCSSAI